MFTMFTVTLLLYGYHVNMVKGPSNFCSKHKLLRVKPQKLIKVQFTLATIVSLSSQNIRFGPEIFLAIS